MEVLRIRLVVLCLFYDSRHSCCCLLYPWRPLAFVSSLSVYVAIFGLRLVVLRLAVVVEAEALVHQPAEVDGLQCAQRDHDIDGARHVRPVGRNSGRHPPTGWL